MPPIVKDREAWSVGLLLSEPCKNGWSDRDAVCVEDSGGPKEPRIRYSRALLAEYCTVGIPHNTGKGKVLPYSLPIVGPGADPGVQAVSPQMTWSHPPGDRLPLLSARPVVTFPAEEHHRPSAGTKLYCLVTEAHACEQLAQGCYLEADRPRFEPATF